MTVLFILFVLLPVLLWAASGLKKIDVGWRGQLLWFGKRVKGSEVGEGWQMYPWPWEIKVVDCRKTIMNLGNIDAITSDNIKVAIGCTIVYEIKNLDSYFNVEPSQIKKGLDEARTEAIRSIVRRYDLKEILDLHDEIGHTVKGAMEHKEWGIDILQVMIPEILPEKTIADAQTLKTKEELERVAQEVELKHFADRVIALMKPEKDGGPGLSREQAIEQVQIALGQLKKKGKVQAYSLDPATAALVAAILEKIGGKK